MPTANQSVMVTIGAALERQFSQTVGEARGQLEQVGGAVRHLDQTAAQARSYRQLGPETARAHREWQSAEQRVAALGRQMQQTDQPSRQLRRQFDQAQRAAASAKQTYEDKRSTLRNLGQQLQSAGVDVQNLGQEQTRLEQASERLHTQMNRVGQAQQRVDEIASRRQAMRGRMVDTIALGAALAAPVRSAMAFEDSMTELNNTLNIPVDSQQYRDVQNAMLDISESVPLATRELTQIAAQANRAGVPMEDLANFTERAGQVAVAWNQSGEATGQMLGRWRRNLDLTQDEVFELADTLTHLGDNTQANSEDIGELIGRTGQLASQAGLSTEATAGLGAALISATGDSGRARRAMRDLINTLSEGENGSARQRDALEELGFGAEEMARAMQDDAQGAILQLMEAFERQPQERRGSLAQALFGQSGSEAIAPLINNVDDLRTAFDLAGDSAGAAGSTLDDYEAAAATTSSQLQLMRSRFTRLSVELGSILLPGTNAVVGAFGQLASVGASIAQTFPLLTRTVVGGTAAIISLRVATFAAGFAFTFLQSGAAIAVRTVHQLGLAALIAQTRLTAMGGVGGAFRRARTAIVGMTAATWAFNTALLANPIGIVVAALAAGAFAVWRYWQPISGFFRGLWQGVVAATEPVTPAFQAIGSAVSAVISPVRELVGWFAGLLAPVEEGGEAAEAFGRRVGESIGEAINWVLGLGRHFEWVVTPARLLERTVSAVMGIIGSAITGVRRGVGALIDWVRGLLPSFDDAEGSGVGAAQVLMRSFGGFGLTIGGVIASAQQLGERLRELRDDWWDPGAWLQQGARQVGNPLGSSIDLMRRGIRELDVAIEGVSFEGLRREGKDQLDRLAEAFSSPQNAADRLTERLGFVALPLHVSRWAAERDLPRIGDLIDEVRTDTGSLSDRLREIPGALALAQSTGGTALPGLGHAASGAAGQFQTLREGAGDVGDAIRDILDEPGRLRNAFDRAFSGFATWFRSSVIDPINEARDALGSWSDEIGERIEDTSEANPAFMNLGARGAAIEGLGEASSRNGNGGGSLSIGGFYIYPPAGQSPEDIAREIHKKIEKEHRERARERLRESRGLSD